MDKKVLVLPKTKKTISFPVTPKVKTPGKKAYV